jgi:hypothetical protein
MKFYFFAILALKSILMQRDQIIFVITRAKIKTTNQRFGVVAEAL